MGHAASKRKEAARDALAVIEAAAAAEVEKMELAHEKERHEKRKKDYPEQIRIAKARITAANAEGKEEATFGLRELNKVTRAKLKQCGYKISEDYDSILGPFYCVDWTH